MRTAVLKRLDDLEAAARVRSRPPVALFDARDVDPDNMTVFLESVPATDQRGEIAAVIITVHPACRDDWLATRHLDDDQLQEETERRLLRGDQAEREAQRQKLIDQAVQAAESRPRAVWGHDTNGLPLYDDDPRIAHLFAKRQ